MSSPILIPDVERRARLVVRHHLRCTALDVADAVRSLTAFHSSDPATPYLAARARVPGFATADLERALLEDRSLWRLHAMRRTLFIVAVEDAPAVEAGASRGVAGRERRKLERWLAEEMAAEAVQSFLAGLEERVVSLLSDGSELLTAQVSAAVPELSMKIRVGSGKWRTEVPVSSRLLFLMAMDGSIVRTRPAGSWRSSQYRWAEASTWFDGSMDGDAMGTGPTPAEARVRLVRRYLDAFGPATEEDVRWWTGWSASRTRAALAEAGVVPVRLELGGEGLVLEGDVEGEAAGERSSRDGGASGAADASERALGAPSGAPPVSFLPSLDPTPMGWKHRDWFLGEHASVLFDRNGNIGPSVWLGGRVVGGWAQRPDGEAAVRLLEDAGMEAERRIEAEAEALADWMDGMVVVPRFRTPLEKELSRG